MTLSCIVQDAIEPHDDKDYLGKSFKDVQHYLKDAMNKSFRETDEFKKKTDKVISHTASTFY